MADGDAVRGGVCDLGRGAHLSSNQGDTRYGGEVTQIQPSVSICTDESETEFLKTAEISEHFSCIEEVLGRYPVEDGNSIAHDLLRLRKRYEDPSLYLGVIGEFSAGKSTFINALLEDDLLQTDVLQGTTCANTLIRGGERLDAIVRLNDGENKQFTRGPLNWLSRARNLFARNHTTGNQKLLEWIHRCTAEENIARHVVDVTIEHPSCFLKEGLVIVDTPGLDAENKRHVGVTVSAVRNTCDSFLVVLPATSAASELILSFIREHLDGMMHRCVFVITKLDLLRNDRERERVLSFTKARIRNQLELPCDPVVLGCSPEIALTIIQGRNPNVGRSRQLDDDQKASLCKQFKTIRSQVIKMTQSGRFVIVAESLAAKLVSLLERVSIYVQDCDKEYCHRHNALEKHRILDLAKFIADAKVRHWKPVCSEAELGCSRVQKMISQRRKEILRKIKSAIESASDKDALKEVISTVPAKLTSDFQNQVIAEHRKFNSHIVSAARRELNDFEQEFRKLYNSLSALGGLIASGSVKTGALEIQAKEMVKLADKAAKKIADSMETEQAISKTSFCGIIVGSAVGGPLGAVVGGLLGSALGFFFGKNIKQLRQGAYEQVVPILGKALEEIEDQSRNELERLIGEMRTQLESALEAYRSRYANLVRDMIRRDQKEREQLSELQEQAKADRKRLATCRERLEASRKESRTLVFN
jgi:predicted GTPase/HAMP domain-containing protein